MKVERITAVPFVFTDIIECRIEKEAGTHGSAMVRGYIQPEKEEEYLMMACGQTEVTLNASGEDGGDEVIYCGILEDMKITCENRVCTMELYIVPYTYLLDLNPVRRSFQVPAMTYQEVLDCVLGQYGDGNAIICEGGDTAIGEPVIQYQETDWEFIKRLASHFNTIVTPSYITSGPKLYFGLLERPGQTEINPICYRVQKMVSEYLYKEQNQVAGMIEDDCLYYIVEDQEWYEVGEKVEFHGKPYYVARMEGHLDGHQLWNTYYLKTQAGFKVPKRYNEKITGASLDGVVTSVQADVVQVMLRTDAADGTGKWFPFSTVYSSPDGSGWYCMPEPGDEIRLYFPTEREKHGYIISAVHMPVAGGTGAGSNPGVCRSDPGHKTISTKSGKIVDLSENSILMDAGNGMQILLDDNEGIFITSPLGVTIRSDAAIDIASTQGKVEVSAGESVNISQTNSKIEVSSENVTFHGANAKIQ